MMLKIPDYTDSFTSAPSFENLDSKTICAIDQLSSRYKLLCHLVQSVEQTAGGYLTFLFKAHSPHLVELKNEALEISAFCALILQANRQLLDLDERIPRVVEYFEELLTDTDDSFYVSVRRLQAIRGKLCHILTLLMFVGSRPKVGSLQGVRDVP